MLLLTVLVRYTKHLRITQCGHLVSFTPFWPWAASRPPGPSGALSIWSPVLWSRWERGEGSSVDLASTGRYGTGFTRDTSAPGGAAPVMLLGEGRCLLSLAVEVGPGERAPQGSRWEREKGSTVDSFPR